MSSDSPNVGYGSPPKQHQFKKGQSGNPRGRPRKSLNRKTVLLQSLDDHVLAEAKRLISVREEDSVLEMSVQEAFVRTTAVRAMKGDRFHAKLFQQMLSAADKKGAEQKQSYFEALCNYKWDWEIEIARCVRQGLPRPEPLPHPDDVLVNPRTGEAKIVGPMTTEEKAIVDRAAAHRDEIIALLEKPDHLHMAAPKLRRKIRARQVRDIERINALLPPRLRRTYDGPLD